MIMELDELWSFISEKDNQAWIWIALCRKTRQVVAYAVGDRSKETCQKLWESIPEAYQAFHCYSDFWSAYQAIIPKEQHTAVGKETGETAHIDCWNQLSNPMFVLAAMEDVTELVVLQVIARCGKPAVFFSGFTNVEGMFSKGERVVGQRLEYSVLERPLVAQIWGSGPENFYEAA